MNQYHKLTHQIRLYWGENDAPKPRAASRVLGRAFDEARDCAQLYPGLLLDKTIKKLAKAYGVSHDQIYIGAGIEGILKDIFPQILTKGDSILTLFPTFGAYEHNAHAIGASLIHIPVGLHTILSAKEILSAVTPNTKSIVIASPNTQTGMYHIDIEEYSKILSTFSGLVIVDECYYHIGKQSVLPLIKKFNNLLILRSASKSWGLAGVRFGFAIGSPSMIKKLSNLTLSLAPDPLPTISYLSVLAILPYRRSIAHTFVLFRNTFARLLAQIPGVIVYHTETTFIPVKIYQLKEISSFVSAMERHNIIIKDTSSLGYLLIGVPPKGDWEYVLSCFQYELSLL